MKILICKSHVSGGANLLLDRLYVWLKKNEYHVEQRIVSESVFPEGKIFDLAILPSYVMNDIYLLRKMGIKVDRILLWIMGMGCFQDGYFNPYNNKGVKGLLTKMLSREAQSSLNVITSTNSICFTDVVGRINTYRDEIYGDESFENENLVPIGISLPDYVQQNKNINIIRACWVGRVSLDFKYIPLRKTLLDLEKYKQKYGIDIKFTIVGDGDALVKLQSVVDSLSYEVEFTNNLPYNELGDFFLSQDIAFVMGTSALDAARCSCASVVVTPVRYQLDEEECYYRWLFESKGYSLGEYPGLDTITSQVKKTFNELMYEYINSNNINELCYKYTKKFDENVAFNRIFAREMPDKINKKMWKYIRKYYYIKKMINVYINIKEKRK